MSTMSFSEPSPRKNFFSASANDSAFLWGGHTYDSKTKRFPPVEDLDILHCFSLTSRSWIKHQLKNSHLLKNLRPRGLYSGACAMIGENMYFYGGAYARDKFSGSLYELNVETLRLQKLPSSETSTPTEKMDCHIIVLDKKLIIYGGNKADGPTGEIDIYDTATGDWSSPQVKGDVPEPEEHYIFTKFSQDKAVRCGGQDKAIYVLDLSTMHWTKQRQSGPYFGYYPTATCMGYDGNHVQILIIGHHDMSWLLDVATWEFKKLQDIEKDGLRRWGHSATTLSSTPTSIEILIFGGSDEKYGDEVLSATTLVTLEKNEDDKWWRITGTIKEDELKEKTPSQTSQTIPREDTDINSSLEATVEPPAGHKQEVQEVGGVAADSQPDM